MANYLYNGVELPDINAIGDTEKSQVIIYQAKQSGIYSVVFGPIQNTYIRGDTSTGESCVIVEPIVYRLLHGRWNFCAKTAFFSIYLTSHRLIWSNINVYTSRELELIYLAASLPIPSIPAHIDKSGTDIFMIGQSLRTKFVGTEERQYLYGIAQTPMPILPAYDTKKYPFAVLTFRSNKYRLLASNRSSMLYYPSNGAPFFGYRDDYNGVDDIEYLVYVYDEATGVFLNTANKHVTNYYISFANRDELMWTNHDIYSGVYYAHSRLEYHASTPICIN